MSTHDADEQRWVRVWFGRHVIADYAASAETANRYADSMARRFAGLRITNEPASAARRSMAEAPLPAERLWCLPPL